MVCIIAMFNAIKLSVCIIQTIMLHQDHYCPDQDHNCPHQDHYCPDHDTILKSIYCLAKRLHAHGYE